MKSIKNILQAVDPKLLQIMDLWARNKKISRTCLINQIFNDWAKNNQEEVLILSKRDADTVQDFYKNS